MKNRQKLISLTEVAVNFAAQNVLSAVTFSIHAGEIVTITGPNGAGKSTLVKVILGLLPINSGTISRNAGLKVGYVPQHFNISSLMPMTVRRFLKLSANNDKAAIAVIMQDFSITHLAAQMLHTLSGGQLRRVLLANALLLQPDLLVLDEPTQGVDLNGQVELYNLITKVRDQRNCGVLMVSHDLHVVMASTDRVLCLNQHICCSGSPEDIQTHPEFLKLFGKNLGKSLAFYSHHHNHVHDLQGKVRKV
ncbi:MAG: zinc ABC transporter ATP-binding protein ZnuC [Legionellales bacterium]|nr:MAG: zinc ABC transporter ATP-binding protein ZnuC [Legionellales bacterium]